MQRIKQLIDENMEYDPSDHSIEDIGVVFAGGYSVLGEDLGICAALACYFVEDPSNPGRSNPARSLEAGYVCIAVNSLAINCSEIEGAQHFDDVHYEVSGFEAVSVYSNEVDNSCQSGSVNVDDSLNSLPFMEI